MDNQSVDRILESLFVVLPVFHKKLLRMDLGGVTGGMTRLHVGIMGMLSHNEMAVSEVARALLMPKSQMTALIDDLVRMGVVERRRDTDDRRVVDLALTEKGRVLLGELKSKMQDSIRTKLAVLAPEELASMAQALETLRNIGGRL